MENQKSSSPSEQEIVITFQDGKTSYFHGVFDIKTEGDWIVVYKLDEGRVVFASMMFFRPKMVLWHSKED